jgi:hypothetical protein
MRYAGNFHSATSFRIELGEIPRYSASVLEDTIAPTALAVKERELSRSSFVRPNALTSAILLGFD